MSLRLDSIQLKNLRSLKNTGMIKLKPITVLVGKNSVGKSTFLRSFPLIRQSCEKQKRAPILWYGKLVDLGDFKTAINRDAVENNENFIGFNFRFEVVKSTVGSRINFEKIQEKNEFIEINIDVQNKEEKTYISKIQLFIDHKKIIFDFELNQSSTFLKKISVDENTLYTQIQNQQLLELYQNNLLPRIVADILSVDDSFYEDDILMSSYFEKPSFIVLYEFLKKTLINKYNTIPNEDVVALKDFFVFLMKNRKNMSNEDQIRDSLLTFFVKTAHNLFFDKIYDDSGFIKNILEIFKIDGYVELINEIDFSLSNFYSSTRYLEPLRATAQRYYRAQELSVDEIDSKGSNIPMFLDNLNSYQEERLKEFILKHFNIIVNVKKEGGHLALTITNSQDGVETNIADLGVGYSQLLPFLVQFWDLFSRARTNERVYLRGYKRSEGDQKKFLLIEQPELHLHPAYQAKTVDMVVDLINSIKSKSLGIIMETHSPNIIYRLSELIENNVLNNNDVQILIFDENESGTQIIEATFDDDGDILNWPTGFFQV